MWQSLGKAKKKDNQHTYDEREMVPFKPVHWIAYTNCAGLCS